MDVKPVVSSEKVIPDVSETVPLKYNYTVSAPVDSPVATPNVSLHTVSSSNMSATDTLLENSNLIGSKPSSANSSISSIGLSPIDLTLDDEDDSDTFH